jgi:hypothetical protein
MRMPSLFQLILAILLINAFPVKAAEQTITYPNGDVYTGELQNGQRHGKGRMKYANGRFYSGEWVHNVRQGYGEQTWSGSPKYISYQGHWANDLPNGTGTLKYQSGQEYRGEFHNALMQGFGHLTYANGDVRRGHFIQNKREGEFILVTANGRRYKEQFVQDKRRSYSLMEYASQDKAIVHAALERIADSYGITTGFKIRALDKSSELLRFGLEIGDVLQQICEIRLLTILDFEKADRIFLAKKKPCTIKLQRQGQTLTLNDIN